MPGQCLLTTTKHLSRLNNNAFLERRKPVFGQTPQTIGLDPNFAGVADNGVEPKPCRVGRPTRLL